MIDWPIVFIDDAELFGIWMGRIHQDIMSLRKQDARDIEKRRTI